MRLILVWFLFRAGRGLILHRAVCPVQRLPEIRDQIGGLLQTDGQADRTVMDTRCGELVKRQLRMGDDERVDRQGLRIAEIGLQAEQLQGVERGALCSTVSKSNVIIVLPLLLRYFRAQS